MADPRFERFLTIPCTIHVRTATSSDGYNNPVYTAADAETFCWLEQLKRRDLGVDEVDNETYRCFLPGIVSISANDEVTVLGRLYVVDGPPWPVVDARKGTVHHIEASLKRTL